MVTISIKKLFPEVQVPKLMTAGSAGADVCAFLAKPIVMEPGQRVLVPTGFSVEIPIGFEIQVRPRSGLAIKKGITVLNSPGTIDSDFRGEVKVILINLSLETHTIEPGERIAQLVVAKVESSQWLEAAELSSTQRQGGGFGSTGV